GPCTPPRNPVHVRESRPPVAGCRHGHMDQTSFAMQGTLPASFCLRWRLAVWRAAAEAEAEEAAGGGGSNGRLWRSRSNEPCVWQLVDDGRRESAAREGLGLSVHSGASRGLA